jgi:lipopolysaccharide export system protein LptC
VTRALAVLLLLLVGCTLDPPRKQTLVEGLPPTENVVELENVAIDRFEVDRLSARARLAKAHIDRARGVILGEEVAISVLDEVGEQTADIRAPVAKAKAGTAVLEGGVVLTDREGRVVRTETMIYTSASDTITAPNAVTIDGENFHARGASLVATRRAQLINVAGPVTATVAAVR